MSSKLINKQLSFGATHNNLKQAQGTQKKISKTETSKKQQQLDNLGMDLAALNEKQKQAVSILDNPVIVIAGPGTGKTKLLTSKIIYILQNTDAKPDEILALTFTESAATNIKDRLSKVIGPAAYDVNIFTFHGFANYLINMYADEHFKEYVDYRIISDLERVQIIKDILKNNKQNFKTLIDSLNPYIHLNKIISQIEDLKREGITLQRFKSIIDIETKVLDNINKKYNPNTKSGFTGRYLEQLKFVQKLQDFLIIYSKYQAKLRELRLMDYADLLNFVLEQLDKNKDFLRMLQEKYQYILVDEYQDTNTAQNKLVFKIAEYWGNHANILVVGDDDQAIYRFQGASVKNLQEFLETFNKSIPIVLNTNYRSLQNIISGATSLAKNITQRLSTILNLNKEFVSFNKNLPEHYAKEKLDSGIHIHEFENPLEELEFITKKIEDLLKAGVPAKEIAVLVRQNNQLDKIMHILQNKGINFVKYGGISIFERPLIRQFIEYLTLISLLDKPYDSEVYLIRALHFKFLNIKPETVIRLRRAYNNYRQDLKQQKGIEALKKESINFWEFLQSDIVNKYLSKFNLKRTDIQHVLNVMNQAVELSADSIGVNLYKFIHKVFKEIGLADYILKLPTKMEEISAFGVLLEHIKTLVLNDPDISLKEFLEILNLFQQYNLKLESFTYYVPDNAVRLLTIHKAKGLEFDYVFIPEAVSDLWEGKHAKGKLLKLPDYVYSVKDFDENTVKVRADFVNLSPAKQKALKGDEKELALNDERRAFYVALTRARYGVFISYSQQIIKNAQLRKTTPSRFVLELDDQFVSWHKQAIQDNQKYKKQNNSNDSTQPNFANEVLLALLAPSKNDFIGIRVSDFDLIASIIRHIKFSASMLITFLQSPKDFYLNYILSMPSATTNALVYGNAFHYALEKTLIAYQKHNRMPNYEWALKVFESNLLRYPITTGEHELLVNRAKRELYLYFRDRLTNYKYVPIKLEAFVNIKFNGYPLVGKIDKIELVNKKDALSNYVQIVDYKTGRYESESTILNTQGPDVLGGFINKRAFQLYFYKLLFDMSPVLNEDGRYIAKWAVVDFTKPTNRTDNYLQKPVIIEYDPMLYEQFKNFVIDTITRIKNLEWIKEIS